MKKKRYLCWPKERSDKRGPGSTRARLLLRWIPLGKKTLGPGHSLGERRLRRRRVHHGQLQVVGARPQLGLTHLHKLVADLDIPVPGGAGPQGEQDQQREGGLLVACRQGTA